jgi:hypothetical protein
VQESAGQFDSLVVLAYVPEKDLLELAANLPEADLVVGGPTGQSVVPQRIGPTLVASATNKGKFLVRADASGTPRDARWSGRIVEMDASFSDDQGQKANLQAFYQLLAQRDFSPQQTSFVRETSVGLPADYRVEGMVACRDCHADESHTWDASRHAHSWESLTRSGAHVDAYCQQCHTTGFGWPGGFASARQDVALAAVGCESCHGPSHAHARDSQVRTTFAGQASQQCVRCHDRENSPAFEFSGYWSQIQHGDGKPAPGVPSKDAE